MATPSPSELEQMLDVVSSVWGTPLAAEGLVELGRTPEEEAEILASVPEAERADFLRKYFEIPEILKNIPEMIDFATELGPPDGGTPYEVSEHRCSSNLYQIFNDPVSAANLNGANLTGASRTP